MRNYSTKNRGILITFTLLVSITFLLSPASMAANDAPKGVHLNWSLDEVHSTMNVTWGTNSAGSGNIVYYDDESRDGNPGEYEFKAEGHHEKIIGEEGKTVGYAHHVTLKGLSSGKTYYFVSGSKEGGFSEEFKFKTLPKNPKELHFAAYGDTRPGAIDFPKGRNAVAREMASHDPQFMIHSGDYIEDPFNGEQWKEYFSHVRIPVR